MIYASSEQRFRRVVNASATQTSFASSMPACAFICDALTPLKIQETEVVFCISKNDIKKLLRIPRANTNFLQLGDCKTFKRI